MTDQSLDHKDVRNMVCLSMVPYFGWLVSVVFLVTQKNHVVRWYSLQSIYFHVAMMLVYTFAIPLMKATLVLIPLAVFSQGVVGLGFLIISLMACLQLHAGKPFKLPVIAELVEASFRKKS